MAESIKFTEEEMNKIKEVQTEYQQKTAVFGQLSFQNPEFSSYSLRFLFSFHLSCGAAVDI